MKIICKIWVNAKTTDKTVRLLKKVEEKLGKELAETIIESYPKINGFVVRFVLSIENENWNDSVLETISIAQRIGYAWQIGGRIEDEFSIYSNKASVFGVESIELTVTKTQTID